MSITIQITPPNSVDLMIIGGGINGAGIAADAARRGLSVILCEKDDLANATSSASTKLIHGGLRYLEYYEFRLVREALAEREVVLKKAPHIVFPMRFVLPHRPHLRPAWMIRAGLFLYDHLGKRKILDKSNGVKFNNSSPLKPEMKRGFEYADCWVDDARLVVLNAYDARDHGATILTRTQCMHATRSEHGWQVTLKNHLSQQEFNITAKALINATGPWVKSFINDALTLKSPYGIRLIKGSHIIVRKFYSGDHAYILQNTDKRIVFVIPYLRNLCIIGTTDMEYQGDPNAVAISESEIDYLLAIVNTHFMHQLARTDIISTYSGVRPLCDDESSDPSAITRDYTITLEDNNGKSPLLSIFGGKITTYRKLALTALAKLSPYFPGMKKSMTETSFLPGGDIGTVDQYVDRLKQKFPWLDEKICYRYAHSYGSLCEIFLNQATQLSDLGMHFGQGLYQREVDYLLEKEFAVTADDILWRRTKLGLFMSPDERSALQVYLQD